MTTMEEMILYEAKPGFMEKGVQIQFRMRNLNDALQQYEKSCMLCSMQHECIGHECSIERAFLHNTKKFKDELWNPDIQQRVELALELG